MSKTNEEREAYNRDRYTEVVATPIMVVVGDAAGEFTILDANEKHIGTISDNYMTSLEMAAEFAHRFNEGEIGNRIIARRDAEIKRLRAALETCSKMFAATIALGVIDHEAIEIVRGEAKAALEGGE